MTRRERLERRLEKRREWAEKAANRAGQRFNRATDAVKGIEPGQPILIGHHSERRHRKALERHDNNMRKGLEEQDLSRHHDQKADGLESQLERSIFSDDPDAIKALQARIAELEALANKEKAINAAWRKHKGAPGWADSLNLTEKELAKHNHTMLLCPYLKGPCFSTNTRANARRLKKRIEEIERRQQRQAEAESNGGLTIKEYDGGYCVVCFAEKPDRSILTELKAAGFWWTGGQWQGTTDKLPQSVKEYQP